MRRDPSKVIKAGKSVELRLSPENYKILNRYLEQTGFPKSIKRVELEMKDVGFEDGSMLYSGTLYLQIRLIPTIPQRKFRGLRHRVFKSDTQGAGA